MRTVEAAGEEKGFVVSSSQLLANPIRHQPVAAELLVRHVQRGPVRLDVLPLADTRKVHGSILRIKGAGEGIVFCFVGEVVVPAIWIDEVV